MPSSAAPRVSTPAQTLAMSRRVFVTGLGAVLAAALGAGAQRKPRPKARVVALVLVGLIILISVTIPQAPAATQEAGKSRVVGLVISTSPVSEALGADPVHPVLRAFVHGLRDLGWVQGRNLMIEAR